MEREELSTLLYLASTREVDLNALQTAARFVPAAERRNGLDYWNADGCHRLLELAAERQAKPAEVTADA